MTSSGTRSDAMNVLILWAVTGALGYLTYRLFGFEFILSRGPFLIASLLMFMALRTRSWWIAAFLLIQVPLQGLIIRQIGLLGNFMTLGAVAAFLSMHLPSTLPQVLLGTPTQRLATLAIIGVSASMLWGADDLTNWVSFGQRVTLLLVMAAVLQGFRDGVRVATLARVAVAATALVYLVSAIIFYEGLQTIPGAGVTKEGVFDLVREEGMESARGQSLSGF